MMMVRKRKLIINRIQKKDPEKQPDQKDPEITANSLSELPMVPFED